MRKFNATSSYVSAEPQLGELDPFMEKTLTKGAERDVLVPFLENILGGFGMFVLTFIIYDLLVEWPVETVLRAAGYWSAGLLSLMCIIRFCGDEVQEWIYRISKGWAEGSVSKELDFLEEENQRLRMEVRQLSAANAQMVKNIRTSVQTDDLPQDKLRRVQDEYTEPLRDASYLCRFHDSHGTIARDRVTSAGQLSRPQWEAAKKLLADSGVPINNGVFGVPVAIAMGKVRDFVDRQRAAPQGFVMPHEA